MLVKSYGGRCRHGSVVFPSGVAPLTDVDDFKENFQASCFRWKRAQHRDVPNIKGFVILVDGPSTAISEVKPFFE